MLVLLLLALTLLTSFATTQMTSTVGTGSASEEAEGLTLDDRPKFRVLHGMQVYRVGGDVKAPDLLLGSSPAGQSHGLAGTVVIWAIIDSSGDSSGAVKYPRIVRHLSPELDQKALKSVEQWKFKPASKKGQAVAVEMNIEVNIE
jgi:TonB family protein